MVLLYQVRDRTFTISRPVTPRHALRSVLEKPLPELPSYTHRPTLQVFPRRRRIHPEDLIRFRHGSTLPSGVENFHNDAVLRHKFLAHPFKGNRVDDVLRHDEKLDVSAAGRFDVEPELTQRTFHSDNHTCQRRRNQGTPGRM